MYEFNILWYNPSICALFLLHSPKQFSSSMSTMFSFPKRSSSISSQLSLYFWFPVFTVFFFFHSSQHEEHAFSMTSNKGQSLVWMRIGHGRLRHLQSYKAPDTKQWMHTREGMASNCKNRFFCRHLEIEQKAMDLVCTLIMWGQTDRQTEGDWAAEIALAGRVVVCNIPTQEWDTVQLLSGAWVKVCLQALARMVVLSRGALWKWTNPARHN